MSLIVCATRGGEGSRVAQLQAIQLAKKLEKELVFLFVADTEAAEDHDESLNPALEAELVWLGKVLLGVAEDLAIRYDWESRSVVRTGRVGPEITRFLLENEVDVLIMGASRGTTKNIFGDDAIEKFATEIINQTGVDVEIARPEDEE